MNAALSISDLRSQLVPTSQQSHAGFGQRRHMKVLCTVILLHVMMGWGLYAGTLQQVAARLVKPTILVELSLPPLKPLPTLVTPPTQQPAPALPAPAKSKENHAKNRDEATKETARPVPQNLPERPVSSLLDATYAAPQEPNSPRGELSEISKSGSQAAQATPVNSSTKTPAATKIVLPSSDADYLHNPAPTYPPASRKLGEHGKVMLRVHVSADGSALAVEIQSSSGYERLDTTALSAVRHWHFVPGTQDGIAQSMWLSVPIDFVLR